MMTNDYLRSVRYLLAVDDFKMAEITALTGHKVDPDKMHAYLKAEDESGFIKCPDVTAAHFLDGMIIYKRGKDESRPPLPIETPVNNNMVLKKLKVAFALKEEDMHAAMSLAGFKIGRSEFSALLRKKGHENYRECGDQFLRNFFKGLGLWLNQKR